ncbi:hypothetical protein MMC21_005122 [Puttea exsequens]|nr:hypothetical protein [Puttea exsequens]
MATEEKDHGADSGPQPPPPPSPSADQGLVPTGEPSEPDADGIPDSAQLDIFTLAPLAALKLLCGTIEMLVHLTGDVPPTPPISTPSTPNLGLIQGVQSNPDRKVKEKRKSSGYSDGAANADEVPERAKTPIGSPEAHPTEPLRIIGGETKPLNIQQGALARKFYSKKPPPISLEEYLTRLHKYCPMSTGVYLATSLYIHRLAVIEKILPVTVRNVHRLVLAGLRVAMKALEDLSYPHRRFAKVGGVSESELGRLEVSFCFVTDFELKVDKEMLLEHAKSMIDGSALCRLPPIFQPQLPAAKDRRTLVLSQAKPAPTSSEAPAAA